MRGISNQTLHSVKRKVKKYRARHFGVDLPNDPFQDVPMTLQEYMTLRGFSRADCAAHLGVTPECIRLWLAGKRHPSPEQARNILKVTGKKVTPNDFYPEL